MAVNYSNLFDMIGEIIEQVDDFYGMYATLDASLAEIEVDFDATGNIRLYDGWPTLYESFKSTVLGWISTLTGEVTTVLSDWDLIVKELNMGASPSTNDILKYLYRDMIDNSQDVDACTVTIGARTYDTKNTNTGLIHLDDWDPGIYLLGGAAGSVGSPHQIAVKPELDGYSSPTGVSGIANPEYPTGSTGGTELIRTSETMAWECISDSESGGVAEGNEVWAWKCKPNRSAHHWEEEGSGNGPNVTSAFAITLLTDGELEEWTGNTPDNWTVSSGVAGTDFGPGTSSALRGSNCLKFIKTSVTQVVLYQELAGLDNLRRYCFGCWAYCDDATPDADSNLTITIGDSGDPDRYGSLSIAYNNTEWIQTWAFFCSAFTAPAELNALTPRIYINGNAYGYQDDVYVDDVALVPVVYHGGLSVAIFPGSDKFLKGDRAYATVSNDNAGTFQTFFRKAYGFQLPSDSGGTESIDDAKAE